MFDGFLTGQDVEVRIQLFPWNFMISGDKLSDIVPGLLNIFFGR